MFDDVTNLKYTGMQAPGESHGNPLYDWLSTLSPRKLKDLFKLAEYLMFNASGVYAAATQYFSYTVTDLTYHTASPMLKMSYQRLNRKSLRTLLQCLVACIDRCVYGNHFCSVYFPFYRFLQCRSCGLKRQIAYIQQVQYDYKNAEFTADCPKCCSAAERMRVVDEPDRNPDRMRTICWDPKLIDIDYNPVTRESVYYWTIPKELKERVLAGDRHIIDTMPMEILRAMPDDRLFRFAPDAIFHLKAEGPSGIENQWGFPPLASTIKLFFYTAILRKANEAIALDYVVPMRIMSPEGQSQNGDPIIQLSGERWRHEMEKNIRLWRRDPLHIMFSPTPVNVVHLGGQARTLLTLGELSAAEDSILAALGIPKEFLYGNFQGSGFANGVQLRMMENKLRPLTERLVDLAQWVNDKAAKYLGWKQIQVDLAPVKLVDDVQQKQMLMALNQASPTGQPLASGRTLQQAFDLDPEKETEILYQEQMAAARSQQRLQGDLSRAQQNMQQVASGGSGQQGSGRQQVLDQAAQVVQELGQMDPSVRKSQLAALEGQDPVLYAVVKVQLEDQQQSERAQATAQVRGGQE